MCTYHKAQLNKAARHGKIDPALWNKLNANFEEFSDHGIEPSMPLPVVTGEREVVVMTWGFRRRFKRKDGKPGPDGTGLTAAKPVVNAQSEKMGSYMWKEAYQHRRCIVPVTEFYEWTGPTGAKVAHRFHMGGDCFFVAGLWENSAEFGLTHTMLTTEPNREVGATGHDRCLVALLDDEINPWLDGKDLATFHRPDGLFQVQSNVPNPRARKPEQGELF